MASPLHFVMVSNDGTGRAILAAWPQGEVPLPIRISVLARDVLLWQRLAGPGCGSRHGESSQREGL